MRFFFKKHVPLPVDQEYFMSLLGGSEGGLATTAAIISGLLVSTENRSLVVTTVLITFTVQAFNGAVSRFSSARTADEIEERDDIEGYKKPLYDGILQLLSHIATSFIILLPVIFVNDIGNALAFSIGSALFGMFILGEYKAYVLKNQPLRDGLELVVMGAFVIGVGLLSGYTLRN